LIDGLPDDTKVSLEQLKKSDPVKLRKALALSLEISGGLATVPDLAKRWHLSRQRVYALSRQHTFPKPVATVGGGKIALYLLAECDAWNDARASNKGSS
jgi:predicted DNA-binding transcriptional regulator AlpA